MDVDIRKYIVNNFKDTTINEIEDSIVQSIEKGDDITLPGLGVFFEILWNSSDDVMKNDILNRIKNNMH
jgi:small acid-soluble spore protein I (minor)